MSEGPWSRVSWDTLPDWVRDMYSPANRNKRYTVLMPRRTGRTSVWFFGKCHELAQQWIALFDDGRAIAFNGVTQGGIIWHNERGQAGLRVWEDVDKDLQNARDKDGDT